MGETNNWPIYICIFLDDQKGHCVLFLQEKTTGVSNKGCYTEYNIVQCMCTDNQVYWAKHKRIEFETSAILWQQCDGAKLSRGIIMSFLL